MADGSLGGRAAKTKTYYACVAKSSGTLKLTTRSGTCADGQRKISFNARGRRGLVGPVGAPGAAGPAGPAGAQGAAGPAGAAGMQGAKGDTGATGAAGPQGDSGAIGPAGPEGDTGATGAAGPKGDTGATGAVGPRGAAGSSAASMMTSRVDIPAGIADGNDRYVAISGISPLAATRNSVTMLSPPVPIVVRDIAIDLDGPAGPTNVESVQFFLEVNGNRVTSTFCSIQGAASSCTNTGVALAVPASSRLDWTLRTSGRAPANVARFTFRATTP